MNNNFFFFKDTNAAIIGGMLGALKGIDFIPKKYTESVIHCDTKQGRKRDDFLHPKYCIQLVEKLLEIAPNKIKK